ncbi:MAG: hypothetical protein L0216_18510 [Planctomycetales bacterium]|nr:hypothetical protein [Planctomycetales bacterium]
MNRGLSAAGVGVLMAAAAATAIAQEGAPRPVREDSVTLKLGEGGSARLRLPGGDVLVPAPGAVLSGLSRPGPEARATAQLLLEAGEFRVEGRGGGPGISAGGVEVVPGTGDAEIEVRSEGTRVTHAGRGPVVLRSGGEAGPLRVMLANGARADVVADGATRRVEVAADSPGDVLLATEEGWSRLAPGAAVEWTPGAAPRVTRGEAIRGAEAPALPAPEAEAGPEETSATLGKGGKAVFLFADGSAAEAGPGAAVRVRTERGPGGSRSVVGVAAGEAKLTLRSGAAAAETPTHRIEAAGGEASQVTVRVGATSETFEVSSAGKGAATIEDVLPHAGPRIRATVGPGDRLEHVLGDPSRGLRYRVPASNGAAVTFAIGTKVLRAPPGTDITFRADATVEVLWPAGPEELFRFEFPVDVVNPAGGVTLVGLPDLVPPAPVSPSKP